jgi:uncharacterized integral membrane protein
MATMRKTLKVLVLVPLGLLILVFAVANRQNVIFTLDPLGSTDPNSALAFQLPLFALAFILVIIGVVIGGVATWFRQSKWRKAARRVDGEARALRAETEDLKRQLAAAEAAATHADPPRVALPPPAA